MNSRAIGDDEDVGDKRQHPSLYIATMSFNPHLARSTMATLSFSTTSAWTCLFALYSYTFSRLSIFVMVRLPTLLESVQLAVVLWSSVAHGQTDNIVEWVSYIIYTSLSLSNMLLAATLKTIGTKIRLFGADTSAPCAASLQDAQSNAVSFAPDLASSDATSSAQDGSNITGSLAEIFYIANGLHKLGTPFTGITSIRILLMDLPSRSGIAIWTGTRHSTQGMPCTRLPSKL